MNYYLRTLEGVGRCFGGVLFDEFYRIVGNYKSVGTDLKDAAFGALKYLRGIYPNSSFDEIYNAVNERYKTDPYNYKKVYEGTQAFILYESRKAQAAQAAQQAAEQARAYAEAMKAQAEAEAVEQAQAEAEAVEQAQAEAVEQAQAEAVEKAQAEAIEQAQAEAEAVEQAQAIINEGEPMQEINIENQVIESTPTYTIIDETEDSITYEDEAGNVHTEPKASAAPWLILASAAAALFLA